MVELEKEEAGRAVVILKSGGAGIFPTDTAFGVGCLINDEKAVEWLFEVKKRPKNMAVPVLVNSLVMAKNYVDERFLTSFSELASKYWPGGLTIVVPVKKEMICELIRGGGETVGFRMPDNEVVCELIGGVGAPIIGTSANFYQQPAAFSFNQLNPEFVKLADFVIKGECKLKKPSTVVDITTKPYKVIRKGAVSL